MIGEKLDAKTSFIDKVKPKKELLAAAIRKLAADKPVSFAKIKSAEFMSNSTVFQTTYLMHLS
jgi:hypothetical protein